MKKDENKMIVTGKTDQYKMYLTNTLKGRFIYKYKFWLVPEKNVTKEVVSYMFGCSFQNSYKNKYPNKITNYELAISNRQNNKDFAEDSDQSLRFGCIKKWQN